MGRLNKLFISLFQPKLIFIYAVVVFGFLMAKNPYSERNLISNLEPYPDTFHYIVPAISLVNGGPFKIVRDGRTLNPSVPPMYSFVLSPFFLVNKDPRTFYFANVFLSFLSIYVLFLIVKRITNDKWILGIILFLFSTNYFMYWYPQWAMAENLILPIVLGSIYLLLLPVNTKSIFLASLVSLLLYSTKYAYLPYLVAYSGIFFVKICIDGKTRKVKKLLMFILLSMIFVIPVGVYQFYLQGVNPLSRYLSIFVGLLPFVKQTSGSLSDKFVGPAGWFSKIFFQKNFPLYLRGLLGEQTGFLWDFTPILPKYIIYPAWIGLFIGIFKKRFRFLSISLLILLLFHLFFIASFSTLDMRYIYHAIPTLLLGFGLFLATAKEFLEKREMNLVYLILTFSILGLYLFNNALRIKYQVALNFRHSETPWYYISVLNLNDYFTKDKIVNSKRPIVISPMPPYYIDYFSNGNYGLLPLAKDQEFRLNKEIAWGPDDYSDLPKLYKKYLIEGDNLYVSTYGLGNESYLHLAFDNLKKDFVLTEVKDGCYTQCKIYKLDLKNAKNY